MYKMTLCLILVGSFGCTQGHMSESNDDLVYSDVKPRVIDLDLPPADDGIGGLVAADLNNDELKDFIITKPNHIVVYDHSGKKLWGKKLNIQVTLRTELDGLPGWHAPGVQAADVDGDGSTEVLYLMQNGTLHIVDGSTGREKWELKFRPPQGASQWEHLVVANFRGQGDRDLLLQATNVQGTRRGRYLAAYALGDIKRESPKMLWARDDFVGSGHGGARVADLNGDGRDEVLGATIVGPDGRILFRLPPTGQIDSIFAADVRPDLPGLEVVAIEEGGAEATLAESNVFIRAAGRLNQRFFGGGNRIFLYNHERLIWETHFNHQEAHIAVAGNFDPQQPGLEVWCRSRYNRQMPFTFDSQGKHISTYRLDEVAPENWKTRGVDVIWTIHWTGEPMQLAVGKERRISGDVAIFDPITGKFLHRFQERADRVYVADVSGDWREELIVLNGDELRIYENNDPNPNPDRPPLWIENYYRRAKMTWNYYTS
jgi:hypothetical protein